MLANFLFLTNHFVINRNQVCKYNLQIVFGWVSRSKLKKISNCSERQNRPHNYNCFNSIRIIIIIMVFSVSHFYPTISNWVIDINVFFSYTMRNTNTHKKLFERDAAFLCICAGDVLFTNSQNFSVGMIV